MNIGQNILEAFDIVLNKRFQEEFQDATKILIGEISETDLVNNLYSVKYQGATYGGVHANDNVIYSLGDIVQVLTDGTNYIIVGKASDTGAQNKYQNYLAQLNIATDAASFDRNSTSIATTVYSRDGNILNGISSTAITNFNDALQEATRITISAVANFTPLQDSTGLTEKDKCYIQVSIAILDKKGNVSALETTELFFEDLINKKKQSNTVDLPLGEEAHRVLYGITVVRPSASLTVDFDSLYINAENDKNVITARLTMEIINEKTIFEESDPADLTLSPRAMLKNQNGGYYYSPSIYYVWGAEDPTVIDDAAFSGMNAKYSEYLGDGWAQIHTLEDNKLSNINTISITKKDIPVYYRQEYDWEKDKNTFSFVNSREFKCVALSEKEDGGLNIIARATFKITNAHDSAATDDPYTIVDISTSPDQYYDDGYDHGDYYDPNPQVWLHCSSGSFGTAYITAKRSNGSSELIHTTGEGKANEAFFYKFQDYQGYGAYQILFYSAYDMDGYYRGYDSVVVFSSKELAKQNNSDIVETYALIKNAYSTNYNADYFNTLTWYNNKKEAFENAYNGINGENDKKPGPWIKEYIDNNEYPFGYYFWKRVLIKQTTGMLKPEYTLIGPEEEWKKTQIDDSPKNYYICSKEEPKTPKVNPGVSEDGHKFAGANITIPDGWSEDPEVVRQKLESETRMWQIQVFYYTDGSIEVSNPFLYDIYVSTENSPATGSFVLKEVPIIEIINGQNNTVVTQSFFYGGIEVSAESGLLDKYVIQAKLSYINNGEGDSPLYKISDQVKSPHEHFDGQCSLDFNEATGQNNSIKYAWASTNKKDKLVIEDDNWLSHEQFNTQQNLEGSSDKPYLWCKITFTFTETIIENEETIQSTFLRDAYFVIAVTLETARDYEAEKSGIWYAASEKETAEEIPEDAWQNTLDNGDTNSVAAQIAKSASKELWSRAKNCYTTFYYSDGEVSYTGEDRIFTKAVKEPGDPALLRWAAENNKTFIDGAKIYTGSIMADQLNVSDLNAAAAKIAGWNIGSASLYNNKDIMLSISSTLPSVHFSTTAESYQRIAAGGSGIGCPGSSWAKVELSAYAIKKQNKYTVDISFLPINPTDASDYSNIKVIITTASGNTYNLGSDSNTELNIEPLDQGSGLRLMVHGSFAYTNNSDEIMPVTCTISYRQEVPVQLLEPAFEVTSQGQMFSNAGIIGGWSIDSSGLSISDSFEATIAHDYEDGQFSKTCYGLVPTEGKYSNLLLNQANPIENQVYSFSTSMRPLADWSYAVCPQFTETIVQYPFSATSSVNFESEPWEQISGHWAFSSSSSAKPVASAVVEFTPLVSELTDNKTVTIQTNSSTDFDSSYQIVSTVAYEYSKPHNYKYLYQKHANYSGDYVFLNSSDIEHDLILYRAPLYDYDSADFLPYPSSEISQWLNLGDVIHVQSKSLVIGKNPNTGKDKRETYFCIVDENGNIIAPSQSSYNAMIFRASSLLDEDFLYPVIALAEPQKYFTEATATWTLTGKSMGTFNPANYKIATNSTKNEWTIAPLAYNALKIGKTYILRSKGQEQRKITTSFSPNISPTTLPAIEHQDIILQHAKTATTKESALRSYASLKSICDSKSWKYQVTNKYKEGYSIKLNRVQILNNFGQIIYTLPKENLNKSLESSARLKAIKVVNFETNHQAQEFKLMYGSTLLATAQGTAWKSNTQWNTDALSSWDQNAYTLTLNYQFNNAKNFSANTISVKQQWQFLFDTLSRTIDMRLASTMGKGEESDVLIGISRTVNKTKKNLFYLTADGTLEIESDFGFSFKKAKTTGGNTYCGTKPSLNDGAFGSNDVYLGTEGLRIGTAVTLTTKELKALKNLISQK